MRTAQTAYAMLGNENLWDTAKRCHDLLAAASIPHAVCGGVAVCLHGYQRNTTDIDIIISQQDAAQVKLRLSDAGLNWHNDVKEFRAENGVSIQFLTAGDRAGRGIEVRVPEPSGDENVEDIEGLPVVRLSRLIEMKIACGSGNVRRTHKDFADVVELIAIRKLDGAFARHLHRSVRATYRELRNHARED